MDGIHFGARQARPGQFPSVHDGSAAYISGLLNPTGIGTDSTHFSSGQGQKKGGFLKLVAAVAAGVLGWKYLLKGRVAKFLAVRGITGFSSAFSALKRHIPFLAQNGQKAAS